MKKVSIKALMVLLLMVASFTATPMMVTGYDYDNDKTFDQLGITDPSQVVRGFSGGFGSIFRGLGYGGNILGTVFEMLLMQTLTNFSAKETLPGVYVMSATQERTYNDSRDYGTGVPEYYMVPYDYYEGWGNYSDKGYAYCEVNKSGSYEYNLTTGAGVTLIIWDNDGSFINAVKKLINFYDRLNPYIMDQNSEEIPEELIKEGVELITWFLIHINDIFTGEELFVLNPISWQKLEVRPSEDFDLTKTWKVTGDDWRIDMADEKIKDILPDFGRPGGEAVLDDWNATAIAKKDSYMQWLLTETDDVEIVETVFTSFTFDLMQFWVKNFEIHIDVGEIMNLVGGGGNGEPVNPAKIFEGLDIEFYFFTHHLTGAFLYNDTNADGVLSAGYRTVKNETGDELIVDGTPVQVPDSSELTHRLILGTVDKFNFLKPQKDEDGNKISWGLRLDNPTLTPVPVGVDLDSYLGASEESLEYIHFGFTFEPKTIELATADGGRVPVLHGAIKLDQLFAPWNSPTNPAASNDIKGLDFAIVYVSTVLHFHLTVDTLSDDPEKPLDKDNDYSNVTHSLKIGNYLGKNIAGKLDFVDIAGPEYIYGAEESTTKDNATSNTLPLALFEAEARGHKTFEGTSGETETFAADISLNVSFNVLMYAVCFPEFDDGSGIWHDPTFSVFMTFEPTGFWALILLIAGVGLVGVATILIKRRKDNRF